MEADTFGFVRCQVEASTAGKTKLLLNAPSAVQSWLDGEPIAAKDDITLDLKPGLHTLTLAVNLGQRREGLRCEWEDEPGSSARLRIVGGK